MALIYASSEGNYIRIHYLHDSVPREAMKMENDLTADIEGKVKRVLVNVGDVIAPNQPLVAFE